MKPFQSAILWLVFAALMVSTPANLSGQSSDELRHRIVANKCTFYMNWASLQDLQTAGSPSENWLGQPEVQLMFKKLFRAIEEYQRANPMRDEGLNELLIKVPMLLRDCPATLHVAGFDLSREFGDSGYGVAAVKLGKHEEYVDQTMKKMVAAQKDNPDMSRIELNGITFHSAKLDKKTDMHFGITEGHFIWALGIDSLKQAMVSLKTPAPNWLSKINSDLGVKRPFVEFQFDPSILLSINQQLPDANRIPEFLHLEEFQSVRGAVGLDNQGFISSMFVKCPEQPQGILAAFTGKPLDVDRIAEMPDDVISSAGARLPIMAIFELLRQIATQVEAEEDFDYSIDSIEALTGLDMVKEILDSFEGTVYSYSKMTGSSVFSVRVKDKEVFAQRMKTFMEEIRVEAEAVEGGSLTEKNYKDWTVYSFTQPPFLGPSVSWCHAGEQLYLALDANSIRGHLRRRGRTRNRLVDDERFKQGFEFGDSKGWGKPMFVSHVDVATAIQVLLPLGQTFLAGQSIPGFDFNFDDVPSAEVLANGVEANLITAFRTKDGIRMLERSTLPGGSSIAIGGVAVGMMLPAVQQVRAAARRATTMNNMRQLMLALHNYADVNKRFPASYSVDKNGKPLLSWRVHILPYLEENELYEKFHLDEPWDSEHNKTLIGQMPEFFVNPQATVSSGKTTFLAVTGPESAFPANKRRTFADFRDGTVNSIGIIDVNSKIAVTWTAPKDFDPDQFQDLNEAIQGNWFGSVDMIVAMMDGSSHALYGVSDEELRHLMNIRDGKGQMSDR